MPIDTLRLGGSSTHIEDVHGKQNGDHCEKCNYYGSSPIDTQGDLRCGFCWVACYCRVLGGLRCGLSGRV